MCLLGLSQWTSDVSLRDNLCVIWLAHTQEGETGAPAQKRPYKEMGCGLCFDWHHSAVGALTDLRGRVLVVLKGKKLSPSGFHQAWQARTKREWGKGGCRHTYSSPSTGEKNRWLAEGEDAVKTISILILTLDGSNRQLCVIIDEISSLTTWLFTLSLRLEAKVSRQTHAGKVCRENASPPPHPLRVWKNIWCLRWHNCCVKRYGWICSPDGHYLIRSLIKKNFSWSLIDYVSFPPITFHVILSLACFNLSILYLIEQWENSVWG